MKEDCYRLSRNAFFFLAAALFIAWNGTVLAEDDSAIKSRCEIKQAGWLSQDEITCTYNSRRIPSSATTDREVKWQLPIDEAPPEGWPVVLLYQGSFFEVEFSRKQRAPFGGFWEARTIKALLDAGYAVIAPRAAQELAWLTNAPGINYEKSSDHFFLNNVFAAIKAGEFGPLNARRKYAAGISSGAYNVSRMAVTWPGEFKALAIQSGSYASCLGALCLLPEELPKGHPPTLFIHGFLDPAVPWWTMDKYYDRLREEDVPVKRITKFFRGHAWFSISPEAVVAWFDAHP